ncbi:MAG: arabinan endo-1,5-alpha-L-arabinosidase [Tannerellaceae bacterium]|nr:arabinan endo-1,5-alpha-L-arabinosidase [Tannerellaceae bacterium]
MKRLSLLLALALGAASVGSALAQTQSTNQPQSRRQAPPFDPTSPAAHDPVMAKEGDTYYVFTTGRGVSRLATKDLKTWEALPPVFAEPPAWIAEVLPGSRGSFWAPDIIYHQGKWHLFYASSAFGKNTSVIGHATSPTLDPQSPNHKWTDCGMIVQSVPNRDFWNAIDPNVIVDENHTPWMNFGSFWGGMKMMKLTDDMMAVAKPEVWYTLSRRLRTFELDDTDPGDGAVEAPFIYKHGKWYYLFVSFDYCCRGKDSDYKVVVGRAERVEGPYFDKEGKSMNEGGGSIVAQGDGVKWAGVGHNSAYTIDGRDYFVTHAYDKETGASKLLIRSISWEDEWPVVKL